MISHDQRNPASHIATTVVPTVLIHNTGREIPTSRRNTL